MRQTRLNFAQTILLIVAMVMERKIHRAGRDVLFVVPGHRVEDRGAGWTLATIEDCWIWQDLSIIIVDASLLDARQHHCAACVCPVRHVVASHSVALCVRPAVCCTVTASFPLVFPRRNTTLPPSPHLSRYRVA